MDTALDVFVFPEPWWDLRGQGVPEAERRQHLLDEARAVLGPQQPFATGDLDVLADFTRQEEVLFRCSEDAFAIVHLTYAGALDPFVRVRTFDSWRCGMRSRSPSSGGRPAGPGDSLVLR